MLSRVADSLYWMSRYIERAEHTTRLLDVNLNLMLDESGTTSDHRWQRMLTCRRSRSAMMPFDAEVVMKIMGMSRVSGSACKMSKSSMPSIIGSLMSSSINSGLRACTSFKG